MQVNFSSGPIGAIPAAQRNASWQLFHSHSMSVQNTHVLLVGTEALEGIRHEFNFNKKSSY